MLNTFLNLDYVLLHIVIENWKIGENIFQIEEFKICGNIFQIEKLKICENIFQIEEATGEVRVMKSLDRETQPRYSLVNLVLSKLEN